MTNRTRAPIPIRSMISAGANRLPSASQGRVTGSLTGTMSTVVSSPAASSLSRSAAAM